MVLGYTALMVRQDFAQSSLFRAPDFLMLLNGRIA